MEQVQPRSITAPELQRWLAGDGPGEAKPPLILDVREDQELAPAPFPGEVIHFPLSRSGEWLDSVSSRLEGQHAVVVLCHAGIRSLHFGLWLLEQNPGMDVWNLEGGIDAWSVRVDPTVARY